VGVAGLGKAKVVLQAALTRRRIEQVNPAYNVGNPLISIVNDNGQLIGEQPIFTSNDEVADILFESLFEVSLHPVNYSDAFIADANPQRGFCADAMGVTIL
jgi:hypothetical protein